MKRVVPAGTLALVAIMAGGCGGSHHCPGAEVTFRAIPARGQSVTPAGMQVARQIMEQRVDKIGVSSPTVTVHGDEIVIEAAGVHGPVQTAGVIGETGQLQVFDFEPDLAPPTVTRNQQPTPLPSLYALLTAVKQEADKSSPESYYLFKRMASHPVVQGPAPTLQQLFQPYKGKQPPQTQVLAVPANREPVRCAGVAECPGAGRTGESWYLFKYTPNNPNGPPELAGKDFVESGITTTVDQSSGQPIVTLQFTRHGSKEFQRITKAEYDRGRVNAAEAGRLSKPPNRAIVNQYAGHNAIVLDGRLEETPYIDYTDATLSQGIVGNAEITEPSAQRAQRTALVLQTGSLPYTFKQIKLTSCSRK